MCSRNPSQWASITNVPVVFYDGTSDCSGERIGFRKRTSIIREVTNGNTLLGP